MTQRKETRKLGHSGDCSRHGHSRCKGRYRDYDAHCFRQCQCPCHNGICAMCGSAPSSFLLQELRLAEISLGNALARVRSQIRKIESPRLRRSA